MEKPQQQQPQLIVEPLTPPVQAMQTPVAVYYHVPTAQPAPAVKIGAWDAGLCGCFDSMVPNCCMACCLPCISLAQVTQRIGVGKYSTTLTVLLLLWFAEQIMSNVIFHYGTYSYTYYSSSSSSSSSYYYRDSYGTDDETLMAYYIAIVWFAVCTSMTSITGWVLIFLTWHLRSKIRERFELPGSCCEDCLVSFCCTCCSIAQMATHVKSYKRGTCDFGAVDTLPAYPLGGQ